MKRTDPLIYGIVISFIVVMFCLLHDIVQEMYGCHDVIGTVRRVFAQAGSPETIPVKDEAKVPSDYETSLMKILREKQRRLDNREKALREEETKIETLKKELTEKIDALKALEEKISPPLEVQKSETDKKYRTLAKMYEATPPEKAAIIFEKMERKMAAEIMLRMNSKKAGSIWAHINRDIGLQIVREITSSPSVDAANATKIAKEISGEESIKPKTEQGISGEKIAGADVQIKREDMTKQEIPRSPARKSSPVKPKRYAGLKEEKSKSIQTGTYKPFTIQIKAVQNLEVAKEYTKMLRDEGIDAYWSEANLKGKGTLYRILVSHFASREDALKYMKSNNMDINYPGSFIYKNDHTFPKKKKKRK